MHTIKIIKKQGTKTVNYTIEAETEHLAIEAMSEELTSIIRAARIGDKVSIERSESMQMRELITFEITNTWKG